MMNQDDHSLDQYRILNPKGVHTSLYFDQTDLLLEVKEQLYAGTLSGDLSTDIYRGQKGHWEVDMKTSGLILHEGIGPLFPEETKESAFPGLLFESLALTRPEVKSVEGSPSSKMSIIWTAHAEDSLGNVMDELEVITQFDAALCPTNSLHSTFVVNQVPIRASLSRPKWKEWLEAFWTGATYAVPGSEFPAALPNDCQTVGIMLAYIRNKYLIGECDGYWRTSARCRRMGELFKKLQRYHHKHCR